MHTGCGQTARASHRGSHHPASAKWSELVLRSVWLPGEGGRSTVDAIKQVRALSEQLTAAGEVALAVSLDITNAFNSLPWGQVVGTLREYFLLPPYLVTIVKDYFRR